MLKTFKIPPQNLVNLLMTLEDHYIKVEQLQYSIFRGHRRRMETEGKAKVVASVWRAKFVQFLAALAVLSRLL